MLRWMCGNTLIDGIQNEAIWKRVLAANIEDCIRGNITGIWAC